MTYPFAPLTFTRVAPADHAYAAHVNQPYGESEAVEGDLMGDINYAGGAWQSMYGILAGLPELRGLWLGSFDEASKWYDLSGCGNHAIRGIANNVPRGIQGRMPYLDCGTDFVPMWHEVLVGGANHDAPAFDFTGGFTLMAWVNDRQPGLYNGVFCKGTFDGTDRSYRLEQTGVSASTYFSFYVSGNGSSEIVAGPTYGVAQQTWHHVAARFTPLTEIAVFVDGVKRESQTVSVPAVVFNSSERFIIGAEYGSPGFRYVGWQWIAAPLVCAAALPDALIAYIYSVTRKAMGL